VTTIREAVLADADALGRVHVEAWRAGYRGMMPDEFLASLDGAARAARWRERLSAPIDDRRLLVALDGAGALVGFAGVGPARDEPGPRGELYAINVAPAAWGSGAATLLLAAATRALEELGHREAILWVLRQNARARRFYEREGWKQTGDRRDTIKENGFAFTVDELRYARAVGAEPDRDVGGHVIDAADRFRKR
jgi:RimJ/RimL family protein N-acetyltransferase